MQRRMSDCHGDADGSPAIITMAFNVPLNNHLATVDPAALPVTDAARAWLAYLSSWTAWNHVRAAASFIAAIMMLVGLRYR